MKNIFMISHWGLLFLCISFHSHSQFPPSVIWEESFPGVYQTGNYTANDIKQSPLGGFVITGRRNMDSQFGGYGEVMVIRVDEEGKEISMNQTFTGTSGEFPWDQEANDMIITPMPVISYLVVGYRDKTPYGWETPPGLLLMQIWGNGNVLFDSLYFNNTEHHIIGRCIQPAINGGYMIACSFREDGEGTEKTLLTRLVQNEDGDFVPVDYARYIVVPVGESGYASWIRPCRDGYYMGGTALKDNNSLFDLFIQKLDEHRNLIWTRYYGFDKSDEFADAILADNHLFITGSANVEDPISKYRKDQIYVVKVTLEGDIVWEKTYGVSNRCYANKIMMTGEGNLLVAGTAYDQSMHTQMILLKINAENGESLGSHSYGSQFENAGIRDAIRTDDFGYLVAGRGSYTGLQDPRVYLTKLDHGDGSEYFEIPSWGLGIPITPGSPAEDIIHYTTEADSIYGVNVLIDSLIHPSVGDLEVRLSHGGATVILADRPVHSGEAFIRTGFGDSQYRLLDWDFAPYSDWYKPEERLSVFRMHKPAGEWTLSITDFGSAARKSTTGFLEGWSLNLLTGKSTGTWVNSAEALEGFGIKRVSPNPIKEEARILFSLKEPGEASLHIYNMNGQRVDAISMTNLNQGNHEWKWKPGSLAPGAYFLQLETRRGVSIRKVVVQQ